MFNEGFLSKVEFANAREKDPVLDARIKRITDQIRERAKVECGPQIVDYFTDPDFINALPSNIRESDEALGELLENAERFYEIVGSERQKRFGNDTTGLLGEKIEIKETVHADGRTRRAEAGYLVNVEYLRSVGINPSKVLFFRVTQPSSEPKPEYYWTSDFFETQSGLNWEVPLEQRKTAITLVADLETINKNGGLIQDVNDDSGLPVRQIGEGSFDQSLAIAKIESQTTGA